MPLKLEPVPSPTGRNAENLYLIRVPRGARVKGGLAFDEAIPGKRRREHPFDVCQRLAAKGGLDDHEVSVFMR
jgi:hypothetical protein